MLSMSLHDTSWTLIGSARDGDRDARDAFARQYAPIVRAYLAARWRGGPLDGEIDDGVQEVFVDCLRDGGALVRTDPGRPFRPFLYGIARTVALRFEQRRGKRGAAPLEEDELPAKETRMSVVFDRAWAEQLMREATALQRAKAGEKGGVRQRRVELLELHFQHGRSIPEIASLWNEDAAKVHHMYADARDDFREALREIVGRKGGGSPADVERECAWMLEVLRRSGE